jgi:CheY-like chemotaxis protein
VPTKILVADDSATMRRVLEMTFAGEDATVQTVDTADAAIAKAGEFAPDIIFADASMPNVDGYELARRIKTSPALAKIAVVVMSSQQTPYDEPKGRSAGVDDHISKPFDTQSVIDRVAQVLGRPRAQAAGGEAAARPVPPPPAARPAVPPASMPSASTSMAASPNTGTSRLPQGTRMGMGAPVPVQAAQAKSAAAAPQPVQGMRPAAPPVAVTPPAAAAPAAAPAAAKVAPAATVARSSMAAVQVQTVAAAVAPDLSAKLSSLGLSREQIEGVLALSREVVEQVVWEIVPDLAEQLIKEEIRRLTAE